MSRPLPHAPISCEQGEPVSPPVLGAGLTFYAGLVLVAAGIVGPPQRSRAQRAAAETPRDLLPTVREGEEQNLRLAGITPESYAVRTMSTP